MSICKINKIALSGGVSFKTLTQSDPCHAGIVSILYKFVSSVIYFSNEMVLLVQIGHFET